MINPTPNSGTFTPVPLVAIPQRIAAGAQADTKPDPRAKPVQAPRAGCIDLVDYHSVFKAIAGGNRDAATYWRTAVRKIAGQASIVGYAMHGQLAGSSIADFACIEHFQGETKQSLKASLQEVALQCECHNQPVYQTGVPLANAKLTVLAIPLRIASTVDVSVVVSFAMRPLNEAELLLPAERLQALLLQAAVHLPNTISGSESPAPIAKALELTGKISGYRDTREFSYAMVGSLANRYGCGKVAMGLIEGESVRVLAISGMDQFKATSPGVIDLQQVMAEAYDTDSIASGQTLMRNERARSLPIHQRLATTNRSAIVSFPVRSGDETVAVLTLEREASSPFTDADIEGLQNLLAPFGPAIALSLRGDRSFVEHLKAVTQQTVQSVREPKTKTGRIARIAALSALVIFFFGWMPYRPATPCTIVPANLNQSFARFDMKLAEACVRSGDSVQAGQVLARFDTRELELERVRLIASRNQAEVEVRKSLAAGDPASASLAKTTSQAFQYQLAAVESKIADCTLTAPANGMVVEADLSTKIGQVFAQGEPILSFAPMDQWELQLHVPERLARFVEPDQAGSFAPIATPGRTHTYRIASVSGATEIVDGKNVIIAKAVVEGTPIELRHGMQGVARTNTGWSPICWIALHGVYETMCDLFWL